MDEILRQYDLSPNQYFFLSAVFNKVRPYKIHDDELAELRKLAFVLCDDTGTYLTAKSAEIFSTKEKLQQLFITIWDLYPKKTPNGRLLRPLSVDSQIGAKAFLKLKKHLTKDNIYKEILGGLKSELNIRERNRTLNYMQHINTWINQQGWESYVDENESEEEGSVFEMG